MMSGFGSRIFTITLLALQALSVLPARATPDPIPAKGDKYAVIVGVSKFKDPGFHLDSGAADAEDFHKYLTTKGNFAPGHVLLLTNEQATRNTIWKLLSDTFLPIAHPEDLVVVYFSTIGTPAKDDIGKVNYLAASDSTKQELFANGIPLQDLARAMRARCHSDNIVFFINSSYSGAIEVRSKNQFCASSKVKRPAATAISSCAADQISFTGKNAKTSIFNRRLIEALQLKGNATTLGEAFEYLKTKVQADVKAESGVLQTPVIQCENMDMKIALPVVK